MYYIRKKLCHTILSTHLIYREASSESKDKVSIITKAKLLIFILTLLIKRKTKKTDDIEDQYLLKLYMYLNYRKDEGNDD